MTKVKVKAIKKAYKHASEFNLQSFEVEGLIFLTSYAKYLLEYIKQRGIKDDEIIELEQQK